MLIEREDADMVSFRLKDLVDVDRTGQTLTAGSLERLDQRPIVHWTVEAAQATTLVIAEDDQLREVKGRLEPHQHPAGTVVQLERIGYAILLEDGRLLMAHE